MVKYPKPDAYRSGSKVAFHYYKDPEVAKEAAAIAANEAERLEQIGYDFGFRTPGAMTYCHIGNYAGMTEVVVP